MSEARTFDPIWEQQIYGQGNHLNRYPFDCVVSFVFRHYPRGIPRDRISILEIGSGAGNNLWFAAREGFRVVGLDGSESAVRAARQRFADEGLAGEFHVGDFTTLPFEAGRFDLAIDRGSLTCCGLSEASRAVREVARVLKPGGRFFCNPYSDKHTSARSGHAGEDGVTLDVRAGTLTGVGQLCFYAREQVDQLFSTDWRVLSLQHLEILEVIAEPADVHAEWRIIAERLPGSA